MAEIIDNQQIQDPSTTGVQGLRGLRPSAFSITADDMAAADAYVESSLAQMSPEGFHARDDAYRGTPTTTFIGSPQVGDSRFDYKMNWASDFDDLNENRGRLQSGLEQVGVGVLKGSVLATTTFLDGVGGTIFGLGNLAMGGSFTGNIWSQAMQSINNWSEEALPSYYREHELNSPWYQNLFTANFIGDKFLKNLGFAVGAAYSGRVNAGLMSKVMGMNKARQAFKGAMVAQDANLKGQTASQIAGGLSSGRYTLSPGALSDDLAKQAAQLRSRDAILQMTGALSAGIGEARIESLGVADEYIQEKTALLEQELQEFIKNERNRLLEEPDGYKYFNVIEGADGQLSVQPTLEGNALIYDRIRDRHQQALRDIHEDAARVGNIAFLTNTAVLTASDWIQFGKFYAGGYRNARRAKNMIRDAGGSYTRNNTALKDFARIAKNPLVEGNEEMLQSVAALGAGYMYDNDSFLSAQVDPEANRQTMGYIKAMAIALRESYGDIDNYEEFFIGYLTGGLGVPSFQGIQGGIAQEVREARQQRIADQQAIDELNKIWTPELTEYYQNLVRNNTYERLKEEAADKGDEFLYKNHELEQLVSNVITFDANGRIQDLIDLVEGFGNISSEEDIDNIRASTVDKATGKSIYDGMTNEQVQESVRNQAKEYSGLIKKYQQISSNLQTVAGKDHTSEGLKELTWMLTKIDNWESRFKTLHEEVRPMLSDMTIPDSQGDPVSALELFRNDPQDFFSKSAEPIRESLKSLHEQAIKDKEQADRQNKKVKTGWRTTASKGYKDAYARLELLKEAANKSNDEYSQAREAYVKLSDMQKMLESRSEFLQEYNRYITMPQALEEKIKEVINKAEENQKKLEETEDKKSEIPTEKTLENIEDLQQFKDILSAYQVEGLDNEQMTNKRRAIADRLSKKDHPVAMRYMDISNTGRAMRSIIEKDIAPRPNKEGSPMYSQAEINTALRMLNHLMDKSQSGQELRDLNSEHLLNIRKQFDSNGNPLFPNPMLAIKGINIIKESIALLDQVENKIGHTGLQPKDESTEAPKEGSQRPDPKPVRKPELPVLDPSRGEKPRVAQEETGKKEAQEERGPIAQDAIPGGTREQTVQSFKENSRMDQRSEDPGFATEENPHRFWRSSFAQNDLAALKQGEAIPIYQNSAFSGLQAMWEVLSDNGAWDYVNQGKVLPGDTVTFRIDPKVNNREGITGNPILIYKGEQMIGLMPVSAARYHLGMKSIIDSINVGYSQFLSENAENQNEVYQSPITTTVSEVLPGRMVFTGKRDRPLSQVENIKSKPITFSYVKAGVFITPNANDSHLDIGLEDPSEKEGRLYYRMLGADGRYYPAEVNIKHFNEEEFNIDDNTIQGTQTYKSLVRIAGEIYDSLISNKGSILKAKDQMNGILYFPGELNFFKTTTSGQTSIQIALKQEGSDSNIFNEFIIVGTPQKRAFSVSDEGLSPREGTEASMRPKEDVVIDIIRALQSHNPRFQVAGSLLNTHGYNDRFINDGILYTNLLDATPQSAWFKMTPLKEDGTPYKRDELGLKDLPASQRNAPKAQNNNPISGTETVSPQTTVSFRGVSYNVNPDGTIEGSVPAIHRPIIEDLALIKLAAERKAPPGVSVHRAKDGRYIRLKRANNTYDWFSIYKPDKSIDDQTVSDDSRSPVEYMGIPESKKAEQEYRDSIGEDAYNKQMQITPVRPQPVKVEVPDTTPELDLVHVSQYDSGLGKGVKGYEPFRKHISIEDGNRVSYSNVYGKRVSVPGFEFVDVFVAKVKGGYTFHEASTGMTLSNEVYKTISGGIDSLTSILANIGEQRVRESIEKSPKIQLEAATEQPVVEQTQEAPRAVEQPKTPKATPPKGFMDLAKRAGLQVNDNFKAQESPAPQESSTSEQLKVTADSSFEQFAEIFPGTVASKGITKSAWDKMSRAAKEHEIRCAIPF